MAKEEKKILVLVRHGLRDKTEDDNGLNAKGWDQAGRVAEFYRLRFGEAPAELWSSPKRRCLETLAPLAKDLDTKIGVVPELDEQNESAAAFARRLRLFLGQCRKSESPRLVASSHGDCIPQLLKALIGAELQLKKGGWAEVHWAKEKTTLQYFVQTPMSGVRV